MFEYTITYMIQQKKFSKTAYSPSLKKASETQYVKVVLFALLKLALYHIAHAVLVFVT